MRGAGERPWDLESEEEVNNEATMEHYNAAEVLEEEFADRLGPYVEVGWALRSPQMRYLSTDCKLMQDNDNHDTHDDHEMIIRTELSRI
ncbi:hypothetical protein BDV10DRAFT_163376 [Aspergillus recurvatus]